MKKSFILSTFVICVFLFLFALTSCGYAQQQEGTNVPEASARTADNSLFFYIAAVFVVIVIVVLAVILKTRKKGVGEQESGKGRKESPGSGKKKRLQVDADLLDVEGAAKKGDIKSNYYLKCCQGADKDKEFDLKKHVVTAGRHSTDGRINDLEISSLEKKVSRSQAKLVYKDDEKIYYLINESDSSIKVNDDSVIEAYPLREGDKIEFGGGEVCMLLLKRRENDRFLE